MMMMKTRILSKPVDQSEKLKISSKRDGSSMPKRREISKVELVTEQSEELF